MGDLLNDETRAVDRLRLQITLGRNNLSRSLYVWSLAIMTCRHLPSVLQSTPVWAI